jgi:DNA sulfur modification protein DndD
MWIEKIELVNFKSYKNQIFNFPMPYKGRNLVLIGGMNGFGKTTLLEALYLCFYGEDATHHLARAGLQGKTYVKFLESALHGSPSMVKEDRMSVTVKFMNDENHGYEVARTWFFNRKGSLEEFEVRLCEIINGQSKPLNDTELTNVLEIHAVPANLAPFFFFDGEEVKKLADQDRNGWIKQGMESLMGVVLLKKLRDRLVQYQGNRRVGPTLDRSKLDQMLSSLNEKTEEQEQLQEKILNLQESIAHEQIKRDEIQHKLLSLGVGNYNIKNVEEILNEEASKKQQKITCEKNLESLLADKLPFHLITNSLMNSLDNRFLSEKIRLDWDIQKQELEPRKNKFSQAFFNTDFIEKFTQLNQHIKNDLVDCIAQAWETLYFPRPDDCAEEIVHNYLEPKQRQKLENSYLSIKIGANDIRELLATKQSIDNRLSELKRSRIKLESIDNDGVLQKLNAELADIQEKLEKKHKEFGDLERQSIALNSVIRNEKAAYERDNDNYIKTEPAKSSANKAQRVINLIDDLLPNLFALKTEELSQAVTKHYQKIAHKQQVSKIQIETDGTCKLHSVDGNELKVDRSAGENQVFATALFAGLADVSGYHIPLVVDTPLARLDSQHRKNLLNYWCSDPDRQVILLSQDEEVDDELIQLVKPNICKTYLLESNMIEDGIYGTVAKENVYFGIKND